ncbi:MAG: hypothetical protein AAF577_00200 [Pseudomonadota bacterium]
MSDNEPAPSAHPAARGELIDDHPYDAIERLVLEIARRMFTTFAAPETHSWLRAFEVAEHRLGAIGASVAHAVAEAVQVLRANRQADFGFINPDCPCCRQRLTHEERYFINVLHAVRRQQRSEALLNSMFVCAGNNPDALVLALTALADRLPEVTGKAARPRPIWSHTEH